MTHRCSLLCWDSGMGGCWHVVASPSSWITSPSAVNHTGPQSCGHFGIQSVAGERLRILDSRGTEGAGTWRRALSMAQDSQCRGGQYVDGDFNPTPFGCRRSWPCHKGVTAGKRPGAEEGLLVLAWDDARAPLLAQMAEKPRPGLPEWSVYSLVLSHSL